MPKVENTCEFCGKTFLQYECQRHRKFCSRECYYKFRNASPKISSVCEHCGKEFVRYKSAFHNRSFCSKECYFAEENRGCKITITCDHCGKEFTRYKGNLRDHNFCSRECYSEHKHWKPKKMVTCENCGVEFERWGCNMNHERHFCSTECHRVYFKTHNITYKTRNQLLIAWKGFSKMENAVYKFNKIPKKHYGILKNIPSDKVNCYLSEARAILEGKNWQGKNKCVKLEGDS